MGFSFDFFNGVVSEIVLEMYFFFFFSDSVLGACRKIFSDPSLLGLVRGVCCHHCTILNRRFGMPGSFSCVNAMAAFSSVFATSVSKV